MKYAPEKKKKKNLNLVNTASFFFFNLLPVDNSSKWAAPYILGGGKPQTALRFSKTGKGEIEGTIMLLSSWERNEKIYTKHTVNYDLCCTFILLLCT